MSDLKMLWDYNRALRHRFFDAFAKIPWNDATKNREASYHSIRNIFLHVLNAEEWWLNTVVPNKGGKFTSYEFENFPDVESVKKQMELVESKTTKLLNNTSEEELKRAFEYTRSDGAVFRNSLEEILFHLIMEETHHRGELIALFWQMNVEPPHFGVVQFLRGPSK